MRTDDKAFSKNACNQQPLPIAKARFAFYGTLHHFCVQLVLITSIIGVHALACFPTRMATPPILALSAGCPLLVQTLTNSNFSDGILSFTYNDPNNRTSVVANCSEPNPPMNLFAGIVVNQNNFLDASRNFVTFPGTCNQATGQWLMGNPPLAVNTIECLLATGPGQIGG